MDTERLVTMFLLTIISTFDIINGGFIEKLVDEHKDRMVGIAMKYTHNQQDAEDVVQETFLKIYRHVKDFKKVDCEEVIPLIVIYTKRTAIDFLRKKKRQVPQVSSTYVDEDGEMKDYDYDDNGLTLDEIMIERETTKILGNHIDALTEEQRHIILLKYWYDKKDKDIAKIMGISETAVSTRLSRIKALLRERMEEESHD